MTTPIPIDHEADAEALFADYAEKARVAHTTLRFEDARAAGVAWARFIRSFRPGNAQVVPFRGGA